MAFVDADIGQRDVGPPATISLAYPEATVLSRAPVAGLYFVGAVSPAGQFLHMVVGTRRMVDAVVADFVVVDTTGLVHGPGRILKASKIECRRPDVIAAIAHGPELMPLIRAHRHHNILPLRPSPKAVPKSPSERRRVRERAFQRYFAVAQRHRLDLGRLIIQRSPLFAGTPFRDERFLYAERTSDGIVAVAEEPGVIAGPRTRFIPAGLERGLLCGLADQHGEALGLGIVQEFDFRRAQLSLLTSVSKKSVKVVQLGELHLTREGRELPRVVGRE